MTAARRHFRVAITASVCLVVIIAVTFAWIARTTPQEFNSKRWQQDRHFRPRMLHNFLATHDLKGMSRHGIDRLLGVPSGQDSRQEDRYLYWVGYAGIDDNWLDIRFQEGRVVEVSVYPD